VGEIPKKSTTDPISGVGAFMLKETCARIVRHFKETQIINDIFTDLLFVIEMGLIKM
jgi:hypothetical protein